MINLTALIVVALYLVIEAVERVLSPEQINGKLVIIVASVALAVDVGTVVLLWAGRTSSVNIRAAVLHNVSDALASVGVIIVGIAVMLWNFRQADILACNRAIRRDPTRALRRLHHGATGGGRSALRVFRIWGPRRGG